MKNEINNNQVYFIVSLMAITPNTAIKLPGKKKYKRNSFKPPIPLWNIALWQLIFGQHYFFALAFNPPHWKPHYLFENWVVIHGMEDRLMHLWCGQICMLFLSHMFFLWLLRSSKIRLMANLDSQAAIMNKLNVNWTPPPPF